VGSEGGVERGLLPGSAGAVPAAAAGIAGSVMACAFVVTDLGLMTVLGGTLSVGGFVALAPGLVGLWLSHKPGVRAGFCWRVAMHTLIWGGLALSVAGVFLRDNSAAELGTRCWWTV